MTTDRAPEALPGGTPVDQRVGRLAPERDDVPRTVYVLLDEHGVPQHCAAWRGAAQHYMDSLIQGGDPPHSMGLWEVREYVLDERTRSQALADAGFTRRPSLRAMEMRAALELIAAPMRPDGTWNRDREACRELAAEVLGCYDDRKTPNAKLTGPSENQGNTDEHH